MDLELKKDNLPILKEQGLKELNSFNIIIGENGTGKTRFLEGLERDFKSEYNVISIKANNVTPSNDVMKSSAASSGLIKNVTKLFDNLNITPVLKNRKDIVEKIDELVEFTNTNFSEFTGENTISIKNDLSEDIAISTIIQSMLGDFLIKEDGIKEEYKIDFSAQGHQRLFIASMLKTYIDLGAKYGFKGFLKENILFFEEPELFLHPKLKRELNKTLKKIAGEDNKTTVIISTHDPYFIYSNKEHEGVKTFYFSKSKGKIVIKEDSLEQGKIIDELTHILLFNKMMEKMEEDGNEYYLSLQGMESTSEKMKEILNDAELVKEKPYDFKDSGNLKTVLLPIYIRNTLHHKNEVISHEDLELSIRIMSKIISNL